jgi:hypothetical protein
MKHRIEYEHYFECDACEGDWVMYDIPHSNVVHCPHCGNVSYADPLYNSVMRQLAPPPSQEEQRVISEYFNEV